MKVVYVSNTCSAAKYKHYVESKGMRVSQQAQKYNLLLSEGLARNGADVYHISTRPINRVVSSRIWFGAEKENAGQMQFDYLPFVNYPGFRNVFILFGTFFHLLFTKGSKHNTVVACDALNIMGSLGALCAAAFRGLYTVGIVTDVPCHLSNMNKIPFSQKINLWVMRRFKSYLLLTEQMSEIVNPNKRPFIVLEGHADQEMAMVENCFEAKNPKKICLYAGSLKKAYGIQKLVEGFIGAGISNSELHIYGNGDYLPELQQMVKQHENVKYLGIAPNSEIVKAELAATLLINPRPSHEEYTKYSFPSKNMEYMASGTPVLTTKLPGMPADHKPYVYLIEEETPEGIAEVLKRVLAQTPEEMHRFGMAAKDFVLQEKSNIAQASKVLRFMKGNLCLEE